MKLFHYIFNLIFGETSGEQKEFSEKVIYSFILQVCAAGLVFLSNLVLARVMSVSDYGIYTFAFSLATMLSTIATSGFVNLLMRKSVEYISSGRYDLLKGLLAWTNKRVLLSNILIVVALCILVPFSSFVPEDQKLPLLLASLSIPLLSAIIIYQSALNGAGYVIEWQLPEKIIKPFLLIIISLLYYFIFSKHIDSVTGIIIHVVTFLIAFILTMIYMQKKIVVLTENASAEKETAEWKKSFYNLFLLSVVAAVNSRINVLMLGFMKAPKEVAVFNVASRLAEFISFALFVINIVLAPAISKLYSTDKKQELQQLVFKAIRTAVVIALPLLVLLVFAGNHILALFGQEFIKGFDVLIILSVGNFIGVITGAAGYLLLMTGNEKPALYAVITSTILNVILCLVLIPLYGINGAAWAGTACLITWNLYMAIAAKWKTGINPTSIGKLK